MSPFYSYFRCFPENSIQRTVLIGFDRFFDESRYDTANYIDLLTSTLDPFGKTLANVSFFVADNCATNKSISNKTHIPMIGCACHRLNLAVKKHLERFSGLISSVRQKMSSLTNMKSLGEFMKLSRLHP